MSHSKVLVIAFLAGTIAASAHGGDNTVKITDDGNRYVEQSRPLNNDTVVRFKSLVDRGFIPKSPNKSNHDYSSAGLSTPLASFYVRLDQLAAYLPSRDPGDLLIDRHTVTYLIRTDKGAIASVAMTQLGNQWKPTTFGTSEVADLIDTTNSDIKKLATEVLRILVEIPAMNATFIGTVRSDGISLTPIKSDPELGLEQGKIASARETFVALSKVAKQLH